MIEINGEIVQIEHFPDGTQRLNVDLNHYLDSDNIIIWWTYECEEELSTLIFVTQHIKDHCNKDIKLFMPYLPNSRMDRIQNNREVFTLKYFANVINWLGFTKVYILDVHSNVGIALLDRAVNESPKYFIKEVIENIYEDNLIIYFPDEGAAKRYADMLPGYKYCYGKKNRDWETGKILGLEIVNNGIDLNGKTILMIDDIISYGGSLYYSAKVLKENGVGKIYAFVTHTENSILNREKGTLIKLLEDGTVEKLFTANSLFTGNHEKITVMEV